MAKILIVILSLFIFGCSNNVSHVETTGEDEKEQTGTDTANAGHLVQLNNGSKWKTDEATKKNVAAMIQLVNDSANAGKNNKRQLATRMQQRVDSLVQQCRMKGPDHEVLHKWLEQVLRDLRQVREHDENDYERSYARLKKDVESFHIYFE